MSFSDFFWAYILTGILFVIRIMGTHGNHDKKLHLYGRKWTFENFKNQISIHPVIIILTILSVLLWFPNFLYLTFWKEE